MESDSLARNCRVNVTACCDGRSKGCINLLLAIASYFFDASINKVNPKNRRFLRVTAVYCLEISKSLQAAIGPELKKTGSRVTTDR